MNPSTLFLLAILVPIILASVLLIPPYLGMFAATYIVYTPEAGGSNPIVDKFYDVFYIVDAYNQLLHHWMGNKSSLSLVDYTLPVIGLPAICTVLSLWLTIKLSRKFLNVFYGYAATGN